MDDNPTFTNLTRAVIQLYDDSIQYIPVHTTDDARKFFNSQQPDLFISDLMIGSDWDDRDGIQLIKDIHKDFLKVPIMVLSARCDTKTQDKLREYITHYQVKMFQSDELTKLISNLLQKGTAHDKNFNQKR